MKSKLLTILTLTIWGISSLDLTAQKIQIDSLEEFIEYLMKDFDLPGLAIGIVQNDTILYCKGFGSKEVNRNLPVDKNTIFGIGSISKSFTALTLGILVDEGKINWNDKVTTYLPYFEMYNPYVTENFTIRDLLTHRSGLKDVSGGTLWYHSDYSRIDIISKLKYLEPASGFREEPAYQNVMYVVAGEIVREVSGMSWDNYLKINVFDELGMKSSTSISIVREKNYNIARPHVWNEEFKKQVIEQEGGDNLAAGGFIYSSAEEMSNYMRLLLGNGVFESDTVISSEVLSEIFRPQIHFPLFGPPINNEFTSYGFGWWLTPKNGHKIIEHSGGIDGMAANLVMIDGLNFGVVVLSNTDEIAPFLLTFKVLEQVLGDESYDVYKGWKAWRDSMLERKKKSSSDIEKSRIGGTKTSLDLNYYSGTYADEMYGDITISVNNDGNLEIAFSHSPIFQGVLNHWHYDTFKVDWYDVRVPDGFVTFNFNSKREILGVTIDQENLLDVDFGEIEIIRKKN
jgi:CubicO group peptidase (beta-lactamase class C family)